MAAAFDNHEESVNRDDVDVVAFTVKMPHPLERAISALNAGKAAYCEWPLGNGLAEAVRCAAVPLHERSEALRLGPGSSEGGATPRRLPCLVHAVNPPFTVTTDPVT